MKLYEIQFNDIKPNRLDLDTEKKLSVNVLNEMNKRDGIYYFQEYSRVNNRSVKIGVEIEKASRVSIKNHPYISFIESSNQIGLWYMEPDTEAEIGFNVCGRFAIEAFDINDELISQENILIFPKTMTIEQYDLMQAEVRDLLIAFHTLPSSKELHGDRLVRSSSFPLQDFKILLQKFKRGLEDVLEAPAEILTTLQKQMRRESIKRWTPRTLANSQQAAGQPKIKTEILERTHHILEHRMIRHMLDTLNAMIQQAHSVESASASVLENEIKSRSRVSTVSQSGTERSVMSALRGKQEEVKRRLSETLEKIDTLNDMKRLLQLFRYEEPLFNVSPEPVEETHLFIHDPRYNEVFECYEQMINLIPRIKFEKKQFIDMMVKSPYLFEVWTLLQLYSECMRLQFVPTTSITDQMFINFNKHKKLKQLTIKFTHLGTKDRIHITYEPEITIPDGSLRKPDYYISFINEKAKSHTHHTLDAKYKPYSAPRFDKILRRDILHSCRRYMQDFSGSKYQLQSASLVHNDAIADTHNWNVRLDQELPYTFSHFNIAPGRTNHLNTYMKRIIHQYNGNYGYCPSCGKMNIGDPYPADGAPYKWTYICECQEVWVNNMCKSEYRRRYHPDNLRKKDIRLLKYAHGNYNKQVEDRWDVHCQVCNRSHQGRIHQSDILGRKIELQ